MLEGKTLSYAYDTRREPIFSNLDLTIQRGERIGLVGPSGQGKSTLARILSGYLAPDTGWVHLDGAPVSRRGFHPVQLVFQHPEKAVNPRWRINTILHETGLPADDMLERFGIEPSWLLRYPHELSGGELQRVCLVRALDARTQFLICDEMTSMLDALTQARIWQSVLDIADKRSMGMLIVSHDHELLGRTCDQVMSIGSA